MIAAATILIYFFILLQTITINGNKEIIQNIKIISSDGGEIIREITNFKNEDLNFENDESIIIEESSCFE